MGNSKGLRRDPDSTEKCLSPRAAVVLTAEMLLCNKMTSYRIIVVHLQAVKPVTHLMSSG